MITIRTIASIAAILLPLAASAGYAQTTTPAVPERPSGAAKTTTPPAAAKRPDPGAGQGMAKLQTACKSDIEKYCGDAATAKNGPAPAAKKAPEQIVACITANEAKLTAACKSAWTERKAAMKGKPS